MSPPTGYLYKVLEDTPFLQNMKCSLMTCFSHSPHWPSASLLKILLYFEKSHVKLQLQSLYVSVPFSAL